MPLAARERSASARTMAGSLPPSSTPHGISLSPARAAMARPVLVDPVNCTMSTESTTAAPVAPRPVTHARTGGAPISFQPRTSSTADSGVTSDGLMTTAAPASSAGTTSTPGMSSGKFHGVITPDHRVRPIPLGQPLRGREQPVWSRLLVGEEPVGPVGVVVHRVAGEHDLERGLGPWLTGLRTKDVDQVSF